jgi:hypothetical protein
MLINQPTISNVKFDHVRKDGIDVVLIKIFRIKYQIGLTTTSDAVHHLANMITVDLDSIITPHTAIGRHLNTEVDQHLEIKVGIKIVTDHHQVIEVRVVDHIIGMIIGTTNDQAIFRDTAAMTATTIETTVETSFVLIIAIMNVRTPMHRSISSLFHFRQIYLHSLHHYLLHQIRHSETLQGDPD